MADSLKRPRLNFEDLKRIPFQSILAHYGIPFRMSGGSIRANCPLPTHPETEKKDSFVVNLEGNYFQCFSAGCAEKRGGKKGGNTINFVQYQEELTGYYEAAALLQSWFPSGVQAEPPTSQATPLQVVKEIADPVTEKAERFMAELDKKLDSEFRPILALLESETAGITPEQRLEVVVLKLKKLVKREILASYRNGKKAGEGG